MDVFQTSMHVARRGADRLAPDVDLGLPLKVDDFFAEIAAGDVDPGLEVPPIQDAASFVAVCAIHGWRSFVNGGIVGEGERSDGEEALRAAFEAELRRRAAAPPGMNEAAQERVVGVLVDELVNARRRLESSGGGRRPAPWQ